MRTYFDSTEDALDYLRETIDAYADEYFPVRDQSDLTFERFCNFLEYTLDSEDDNIEIKDDSIVFDDLEFSSSEIEEFLHDYYRNEFDEEIDEEIEEEIEDKSLDDIIKSAEIKSSDNDISKRISRSDDFER